MHQIRLQCDSECVVYPSEAGFAEKFVLASAAAMGISSAD